MRCANAIVSVELALTIRVSAWRSMKEKLKNTVGGRKEQG